MKIEIIKSGPWQIGINLVEFTKGQTLVVGEDVPDKIAEDMLRCDYAIPAQLTKIEIKDLAKAEKAAADRLEKEQKEREEKIAEEEAEAARIEAERIEAERVEAERVETERLEAEEESRKEEEEAERLEKEKIDLANKEAEDLAAKQAEKEAFEAIITAEEVDTESIDKDVLEAYARENLNIELDKRKSIESLLTIVKAAMKEKNQ